MPDAEVANLAGQAATGLDRNHPVGVQPDPPAVEHRRRIRGLRRAHLRAGATAGEIEHAAALEKEVTLLGKEQAESREVDLLLVDLHLREVGVDGEVGGQVRRDAVLHIAANIAIEVVLDRRGSQLVGGQPRNCVGLELEVLACRGQIEADQRSG